MERFNGFEPSLGSTGVLILVREPEVSILGPDALVVLANAGGLRRPDAVAAATERGVDPEVAETEVEGAACGGAEREEPGTGDQGAEGRGIWTCVVVRAEVVGEVCTEEAAETGPEAETRLWD